MYLNRRTPFFSPTVLLALALLCFSLLMLGCAQVGLEKPRGAEDTLRYSQATLTGIYTTIGNAAAARSMTGPEARKLYDRLAEPDRDLAAADKVVSAMPPGGTIPADVVGKINLALSALQIVAAELRARLPAEQTKSIPAPR